MKLKIGKNKDNKKLSIDRIANIYNSRSRACTKCPFSIHNPIHYIGIKERVLDDICGQCNKSFIEGFKKGYKFNNKLKQHENSIS